MAATPITTTTPYCSGFQLVIYHDAEQIADLLRDGDNPRPTPASIPNNATIQQFLLAASGELESACLRGQRYSPEDLLAFAAKSAADTAAAGTPIYNAGYSLLQKLVADLCFWRLMQRRQPATADPDRVPGAKQAMATLDQLIAGDRIFPFLETQLAAELPTVTKPVAGGVGRLSGRAANRIFGSHGS